jgi:hypothetical protein
MGVTVEEGVRAQFLALESYGIGTDSWVLALSADTVPYSDTTSLSDASVAEIGGVQIAVPWGGWVTISLGDGDGTATMSDGLFTIPPNTDSVTLSQWLVYDPTQGVMLWGGDLSPPYTPSISGTTDLLIRGITVTLGNCAPSVASGGLLDGLFDSPVIPSASFTTSPAWPTGTWIGGNLGASGSAYEPPGAPPLPQYAILQGTDTLGVLLAQVFSVSGDATVRLCLAAAQRTFGATQSLNVQIDGGDVGVIVGSDLGISWAAWASDSFTLAAGSHTVTFTSLVAPSLDATMFLTMISLAPVF